jgi:hypothetical protein
VMNRNIIVTIGNWPRTSVQWLITLLTDLSGLKRSSQSIEYLICVKCKLINYRWVCISAISVSAVPWFLYRACGVLWLL